MRTSHQRTRYRFAFDIGGTFTDLVLSGADGSVYTGKVLSTHDEIVKPIVEGLGGILERHKISTAQIDEVVAGATTIVTNLIIERKGAPTGLITTRGFRDVIEIGREMRYDVYDLTAPFPAEIVPRALRAELPERVDHQGNVLQAPTDKQIQDVILELRRAGAATIAVCLLHSYRNPAHEERVRVVGQRVAPEIPISLSSEIVAEIREYERTIATVLNAYVMPMVGSYLTEIEVGLKAFGINGTLQLMQSNGGVISRELGERLPIRMLESGPAAGALGAAHTLRSFKQSNAIAFDMGGTTAKTCLIIDGAPGITNEFEAARERRFKKGSGLPIRLPTVDLIEIGAGGGSIAYVDQGGLLKVGPQSAGSQPGPACYGLGGLDPTVTDAALLLGYLDPEGTLSGVVRLRPALAEQAIKTKIANVLGLTVTEAASGIHQIVSEHMASAVKTHAAEKGTDVRRHTLLAFGGAGPIHAREVALRCGCTQIIVPANAGVFSAIGLLVAPIKVDTVRTRFSLLSAIDWTEIEALYADLALRLTADLVSAGTPKEIIAFRRSGDMRYVGQGFEVNAELPASFNVESYCDVTARFHGAYERLFGHSLRNQPIEALSWRLEATAKTEWHIAPPQYAPSSDARKRHRSVYFPRIKQHVDIPVLEESELHPNEIYKGPALVEQAGSTIVIGPGDKFVRDEAANVNITIALPKGEGQS